MAAVAVEIVVAVTATVVVIVLVLELVIVAAAAAAGFERADRCLSLSTTSKSPMVCNAYSHIVPHTLEPYQKEAATW